MKNTQSKKWGISILSFLLIMLMLLASIFTIKPQKAFAATTNNTNYVGYSANNIDEQTLYNVTNTYNYSGLNQNNSYYNVSSNGKNSEQLFRGGPQITVLTHGLGGSALHWSNIDDNGSLKFAYDEKSLISKLDNLATKTTGNEANIFLAKMNNSHCSSLVDLKNPNNINSDNSYKSNNAETTSVISHVSKHIIIVFESSNSGASNNSVYEEFNYMLSKIVYDVKLLNGGLLPKINLVGHSRGGLTNLQYYLDHPDLVAGVYSLGTPYFGSNTADTDLGASFCVGSEQGLADIISRDVYNSYFYRIFDNQKLYCNMNIHAIGGYSQSDFLFDQLIADDDIIENYVSDDFLTFLKGFIRVHPGFFSAIGNASKVANQILSLFRDEGYENADWESWIQVASNIQYIDPNSSFWDNLINLIPIVGTPYFMSDILVPLNSQLGIDMDSAIYKEYGFHRFAKCFDNNNCDTSKLSMLNMPAVVHNLEARDSELIEYICSNISTDCNVNNAFVTKKNDDGTVTIVDSLLKTTEQIQIIPNILEGKKVTKISNGAFANAFNGQPSCVKTEKLIIPDSIIVIGDNSFSNCTAISDIIIGNSVQTIGTGAFENCDSLINIILPDSVSSLGDKAFKDCEKLATISLSNNLISIGSFAFENCTNLKNIEMPSGLNFLGEGAFKNCVSFTNVYLPLGISDIHNSLFDGCENLEYVNMPSNLKKIGSYAFNNCCKLYGIKVPDNVTYLGDYAFSNCKKIKEINVSKNVNYLGSGAFNGCSSLTGFNLPTLISAIGDNAFTGCENINSITVPSKVTFIGNEAFKDCLKLKVVMLPNNISYIGDSAFENCISIESITTKPHINYLGAYAFRGCIALKNISLPNSIAVLNKGVFSGCRSLTSVTIQNRFVVIQDNVFEHCVSLKNVTIPANVKSIGNYAFWGCSNLVTVSSQDEILSIGVGAFKDCSKLKSISISKKTNFIGDSVFYGCSSLTKLVIPKSVQYIGDSAFYNCSNLIIEVEEEENILKWHSNWNPTSCSVTFR